MEDLKPLATDYSVDCDLVADIEKSLPTVNGRGICCGAG